jgi:hypothetical protein
LRPFCRIRVAEWKVRLRQGVLPYDTRFQGALVE